MSSHTVRIAEPYGARATYGNLTGDQATAVVANQRERGYVVDEDRSRDRYTVLVLAKATCRHCGRTAADLSRYQSLNPAPNGGWLCSAPFDCSAIARRRSN